MDGAMEELRQASANMAISSNSMPNHGVPGGGHQRKNRNKHHNSAALAAAVAAQQPHPLIAEPLPLDEAAKMELKAVPNKTPVSVLQELLSRRGVTPNYELVQIEGAIHEPTFRYRVTVADVVAMGTGRSKKEAKHTAAKAVLDKLIGANPDNTESLVLNSLIDGTQNSDSQNNYGEDKVSNNPIGSLQEMCMARHWPPPKYSMEGEEGLPHEREFTIICSILKHQHIGQGKSKKLAKRQAAFKMWQAMQDINGQAHVDDSEIVRGSASANAHYADLKDYKIATLTTSHSNKVSQFHKNLKSSTGVKLFDLQSTSLNDGDINLVQFLQDIATEQQFEVTYVDVEEKSFSGKFQCLVQLSTLPVAVCYGSGLTSKDAQAAAAQNALEYLKIMTKNNSKKTDSTTASNSGSSSSVNKTSQKSGNKKNSAKNQRKSRSKDSSQKFNL